MRIHRTCNHNRGNILVSVLVLLLSLSVFSLTGAALMLCGGASALQSSQSTQALYAADAGIEMALKEYVDGTDHDGDGTIGGISSDGVDGNNPAIGGVTVAVTFSDSVFRAEARGDDAERVIEVTLQ